ncbi:gluconolactonase [Falsiroseomonas bella]|uniref:Gluconolactonase n=1 Tax=Falsiroseomonas bella TaxID=2184016 RepID=A0A317F6V4_9PROT|nr:SMP-30/gluconolactonase/LRE family protein [Falsiroseomonas bella]PWS34754.1 gluconolactonase [Falsiroseomonas bella]
MFAAPLVIQAELFTRLPDALRIEGRHTDWSRARGAGPLHSFLEGPAFDRAGNFYCTDLNHGRIFRVSAGGAWEVFADYGGGPNGLKIHRDGRIFVVCRKEGVVAFDPASGRRSTVAEGFDGKPFVGLNDLCFADNGDLYFTDPGHSSQRRPDGRVYRMTPDGAITLVCDGLPYPNGLVLSAGQETLFVALTRPLSVIRISLQPDAQGQRHHHWGTFLQLSGGLAGPDGLAVDDEGGLAVAHSGLATVWLFDRLGQPAARILSPAGIRTTNIAYGGPDLRDLYITESEQGCILRARVPVAGRAMYSHRAPA